VLRSHVFIISHTQQKHITAEGCMFQEDIEILDPVFLKAFPSYDTEKIDVKA